MKLFATTTVFVVAALATLVQVATAGMPSNTQGLTPRERYELSQRYQQTRSLAPSPEALAARVDLVERYVASHAAGSPATDLVERYVATHGLAPSPEALAARTYTKTYGLAPSPEALAARTPTDTGGGIDWDGFTIVGGGVLFLALLLATGTTVAVKHSRGRVASV